MAQNFTESTEKAIQTAFSEAERRKNTEVTENHLLFAFLEEKDSYFRSLLVNMNLDVEKLFKETEQSLNKLPTFSPGSSGQPTVARNLQNRISEAESLCKDWKDSYISGDHFLVVYWKNANEPFASWKKDTWTQKRLNLAYKLLKNIRKTSQIWQNPASSILLLAVMKKSDEPCKYFVEEQKITLY